MLDAIKNKTQNRIVIIISHYTDGMDFVDRVINFDDIKMN